MRVREVISVSRPGNGGMDVPLVFELEQAEEDTIRDYLILSFGGKRPSDEFHDAACRLAERGIPQAIEELVIQELLACGRRHDAMAVKMNPFPCPQSKVAS